MAAYFKTNPKIVCREEDKDALLFNPETGLVKILNRTGLELWNLCDGTRTKDDLMAEMQKEYPRVPQGTLRDDIERFLLVMRELGLIQETGA